MFTAMIYQHTTNNDADPDLNIDTGIHYDVVSCIWNEIETHLHTNIPLIHDILVNVEVSNPMRVYLNEYEYV
jgi:hypothetical protein